MKKIFAYLFEPKRLFYIIGVLFTISVGVNMLKDTGEENLLVLQAKSFAEGRLDIDSNINDVAVFEDKYYVTFPPFPAMVITPMVVIFDSFNPTVFSYLLGVLLLFILYSIFSRLGVDEENKYWLMMAFVFGTGFWFVTKFSFGVWSFAHVIAVTLLFLAIRESFGKRRAWLLGVFLGLAFLTRHFSIYSGIFFVAILIDKYEGNWKSLVRDLLVFGLAFSVFACFYLWLNYLRFGNPFDTGYAYINAAGGVDGTLEDTTFGLFHYKYVVFNFIYMFFQGPHLNFDGVVPGSMDFYGTSLTYASPFVFLALKAKGKRLVIIGAWATIIVSLIHMLFYHNNGWVQINTQRFTLDFLPVLMILVALSLRNLRPAWIRLTVLFAIGLNVYVYIVVPALLKLMS